MAEDTYARMLNTIRVDAILPRATTTLSELRMMIACGLGVLRSANNPARDNLNR